MPYAVLILAAGQASRMGRCKALLPLTEEAGDHALSRLARLWSCADSRLVVTGFHAEAVEAACAGLGWSCIRNPQPEQGMFSSVRTGLAEVMRVAAAAGIDGVFLQPVDVPLVRPLTVAARSHDLVAVQVYDRRMAELPAGVGLLKVVDAETGHEQYIDTSSRRIRDAHSRWWREQQERLDQTLNRCGVDHVSVATDGDYVRALMTLFARRR